MEIIIIFLTILYLVFVAAAEFIAIYLAHVDKSLPINEKLNKKAADGTIIDSRFQAVVNEAKVFKQQNANYDFVQDMSEISGLTWDKSWNDIMYNNNNLSLADYNAAVDKLMSDMKAGTTGVKYFSDSENAKNHSGAVSAEISKQIQKQQEGK